MTILYSNGLIDRIENRLRKSFDQPFLHLNRRSSRNARDFHVAILEDFINVSPIANGRFALEILTKGITPGEFYFGFVALFRPISAASDISGHELQHISLNILQKYPEGGLYPAFRAEWDELVVADPSSTHAQPHWHFALSPSVIESVVCTLLGTSEDFDPESMFKRTVSLEGTHFAMSTLWDPEDENCHKQKFASVEEFAPWFDNLTDYVAGQLIYICSGSKRLDEVKIFNP
jgi:hypothetical protein